MTSSPKMRHHHQFCENHGLNMCSVSNACQKTPTAWDYISDETNHWQHKPGSSSDIKLRFPEIVPTNFRQDMVLWSAAIKKIVIIKLTVPWEERCGEANVRKRAKYDELMTECSGNGRQTWRFPVKVRCRWFPAQSFLRLFSALGVTGRCRRTAAQRMGQAAEQSSCWIWLNRNNSTWKPTNDVQWLIITVDPPSWECTELGVETHENGWPRLRTSEVLQEYKHCCM